MIRWPNRSARTPRPKPRRKVKRGPNVENVRPADWPVVVSPPAQPEFVWDTPINPAIHIFVPAPNSPPSRSDTPEPNVEDEIPHESPEPIQDAPDEAESEISAAPHTNTETSTETGTGPSDDGPVFRPMRMILAVHAELSEVESTETSSAGQPPADAEHERAFREAFSATWKLTANQGRNSPAGEPSAITAPAHPRVNLEDYLHLHQRVIAKFYGPEGLWNPAKRRADDDLEDDVPIKRSRPDDVGEGSGAAALIFGGQQWSMDHPYAVRAVAGETSVQDEGQDKPQDDVEVEGQLGKKDEKEDEHDKDDKEEAGDVEGGEEGAEEEDEDVDRQ